MVASQSSHVSGSHALAVIVTLLMLITTCQGNASITKLPTPSSTSKPLEQTSSRLSASVTTSTESRPTATPVPSPLVDLDLNATTNYTSCSTGPVIEEASTLLPTGYVYLDIENPAPCAGGIVHWDFCYYVIGFRNSSAEIWPGVWRRGNDSNYRLVGQNKVKIIPEHDEDNSTARCRYGVIPKTVIEVEEGDYIGFYLPDNGVFVAKSSTAPDPSSHQYRRSALGLTDLLHESELITVGAIGRALVKAAIDSNVTFTTFIGPAHPVPSTSPTQADDISHPVPSTSPTRADDTEMPAGPQLPVNLIGGISAAAGGTILVLLLVILCLVAVVMSKRAKSASELPDDSMEYNGMYRPYNENQVVIDGQRTVLDIGGNPAYADNLLGACSSERLQIEHTYESLSNLSVHTVRHIGITQNA